MKQELFREKFNISLHHITDNSDKEVQKRFIDYVWDSFCDDEDFRTLLLHDSPIRMAMFQLRNPENTVTVFLLCICIDSYLHIYVLRSRVDMITICNDAKSDLARVGYVTDHETPDIKTLH